MWENPKFNSRATSRAQPCGILVAGLPPGQGRLAAPRRRARPGAVRRGCRCWLGRRAVLFAGPVARDDLDLGMLTKPPGQGVGLPVRQGVHDRVALQVNQGRPVAVATAPGPVINGEDARRERRLAIIAGRVGPPQQRVGADRHGQLFGQAPAGLAAQRMGEMTLQVAQPLRPACGCGRNPGQAPGEGFAGAGGGQARQDTTPSMERTVTARCRSRWR